MTNTLDYKIHSVGYFPDLLFLYLPVRAKIIWRLCCNQLHPYSSLNECLIASTASEGCTFICAAFVSHMEWNNHLAVYQMPLNNQVLTDTFHDSNCFGHGLNAPKTNTHQNVAKHLTNLMNRRAVMVIVVMDEISDPNSNPGRICLSL